MRQSSLSLVETSDPANISSGQEIESVAIGSKERSPLLAGVALSGRHNVALSCTGEGRVTDAADHLDATAFTKIIR